MVTKFDNAQIEVTIDTRKAVTTLKDLDDKRSVVKKEVGEAKKSARLFGERDTKGSVKSLFRAGRGRLGQTAAVVGKYVALAALVDQLVVPVQRAIVESIKEQVGGEGIKKFERWVWITTGVDLNLEAAFTKVVEKAIEPLQEFADKVNSSTSQISAGLDATQEVLTFTRNAAILGRLPVPSAQLEIWTDTQKIRNAEREFNKFIERGRSQKIFETFIKESLKWAQSQ